MSVQENVKLMRRWLKEVWNEGCPYHKLRSH